MSHSDKFPHFSVETNEMEFDFDHEVMQFTAIGYKIKMERLYNQLVLYPQNMDCIYSEFHGRQIKFSQATHMIELYIELIDKSLCCSKMLMIANDLWRLYGPK